MGVRNLGFSEEDVCQHLLRLLFVGAKQSIALDVVRWPVLGKFLGIDGQDPSDSKSNRLHVHIFRFCIHSFEVYFI